MVRVLRMLRRQGGQSVVELALVLPVLLLLVLGMMDFGRLLQSYLTLQHATREGARLAITGAADSAIVQRVRDTAAGLETDKLTVQVDPANASRYPGDNVTVMVSYQFQVLTPVLSDIAGGGQLDIGARFVSRVE